MNSRFPYDKPARRDRRYLVLSLPRQVKIPRSWRRWAIVLSLVAGSNVLTHHFFNPGVETASDVLGAMMPGHATASLYLLDKARPALVNESAFVSRVHEVAETLSIPPDWLMAVMYAESRFDPSSVNRRGSRATGLIQFMPTTAQELGVTLPQLAQMSATQQLDYVERYLLQVQNRYGAYRSLTDLYLGILYPKARNQDYCYTLYAKPSVAFERNTGLDENQDGRVSVSDIDRYMRRMFPTAYAQTIGGAE